LAGENSKHGPSKKRGARGAPGKSLSSTVYCVMLTVTRFVDVTVPFVPGAEAVTLTVTGVTPLTEKA